MLYHYNLLCYTVVFHLQVKVKRYYIHHSAVADVNVMCDYEHNGV